MMQIIIGVMFVIGTLLAMFVMARHMMAQYLIVRGWKKIVATHGNWGTPTTVFSKGNTTMYLLDAFQAQRGMIDDD